MARTSNTAGPCDPDDHYMLPPERRIPGARRLIDEKLYFVVHAPRQSGKTTAFRTLAERLTAEGRYAALHATCETGAVARELEPGIRAVIEGIAFESRRLAEELRPAEVSASAHLGAESRLRGYLQDWAERCPRPVVLFLDEIDALRDDVLLSVLRQLRAGYVTRPESFPQSMALVGLRDVRDYRVSVRPNTDSLGTSSPFNIKVESLTLPDFTAGEVAELYGQHTAETGQPFTGDAKALAFDLTGGQPWLVNALARQTVELIVPGRDRPVTVEAVEQAAEAMILRRDIHLDSLVDRLREPRVRRVIEPILTGQLVAPDVWHDDVSFVRDLGLVKAGSMGLEIANPIYREVIPRALTATLQESLPVDRRPFVGADGALLFGKLLDDFADFWSEHAEFFLERQPYSEAAAELIFMAFLQRVVNGGGLVDREYGVGRGRLDLCIRWPRPGGGVDRFAVELEVWRDGKPDPLTKGLAQLSAHLDRLGLDTGALVLFDDRSSAPPPAERTSRETVESAGRRLTVLRL